jgi:hypothetical protein
MVSNKIWTMKKQHLLRELDEVQKRSPVLRVMGTHDFGDELRVVALFETPTLTRAPDGVVRTEGPVTVGIRYHQRFLSEAPIPWELVTILMPRFPFHPNINLAGAMCLGHPPAGVSMKEILHMTWAGLVFNMRLMDAVDWHGLNPDAAVYVRANAERFPLTHRGLYEAPEPKPEKKE